MFATAFERLREQHGPQEDWWPAEGPFEVMVGALLVQRTTWRNAALAIARLKQSQCLTPERLARIDTAQLSELIRPAGFYRVKAPRLKALASFVLTAGDPKALNARATGELRSCLLALPGIGPETADAILAFAFERPVLVVDAYTRRFFNRLRHPKPALSDTQLKTGAEAAIDTPEMLNELHALIIAHGQRWCRPKPACESCGLVALCGFGRSRLADSA